MAALFAMSALPPIADIDPTIAEPAPIGGAAPCGAIYSRLALRQNKLRTSPATPSETVAGMIWRRHEPRSRRVFRSSYMS